MKEAGHIITIADKGHIGIVKFLLDGNKPIFGFIPRAAIEKAVGDRELIVGTVCHLTAGLRYTKSLFCYSVGGWDWVDV